MPKRKRGQNDGAEVDPSQEVEAKIVHGKKQLNKAMKLAKNFERQKLDKRIKNAQREEPPKVERLQKEAEALKILDVSTVVDAHLYKTLLKPKPIAESNLLPSFVTPDVRKPGGSEEDVLAMNNVTARMYNVKAVKEAMAQIMGSVYAAIGVPNPMVPNKAVKVATIRADTSRKGTSKEVMPALAHIPSEIQEESGSESMEEFEDFGSDSEIDLDDERYGARLASSSEDEDGDSDEHEIQRPPSQKLKTHNPRHLSITPSGSSHASSASPSPSLSPEPKLHRIKRASQPEQPTKGGSTFLPTLMGGYLSGEESATDDEEVAPPPRKNRRGQQARRAIWEKKFGAKAAHLKNAPATKAANGRVKDSDWDPKRGARSADDRGPRQGTSSGRGRGGRNGFVRNINQVTGENAIPVLVRGRGAASAAAEKRVEGGKPMHPSWIAAKKAKEEKKSAVFGGKKVVFD